MPIEILNAHVERVVREDRYFEHFWRRASEIRRADYRRTWEEIEGADFAGDDHLIRQCLESFDAAKRYFVRIQEREFLYHRIRDDWALFVRDANAKERLFQETLIRLEALVKLAGLHDVALIYGNIKDDASLDRKLRSEKTGTTLQANIMDLWDVVRFRIVVPDLGYLMQLSLCAWEKYFDQVLRCRNYYYRARNGDPKDPYRAIHFELANDRGHVIELQLMTKRREAVSLLDHAALFKGTLESFGEADEKWLREFSAKGNVLDAREWFGGEMRCPVCNSRDWSRDS
jgi:hypothetical protein